MACDIAATRTSNSSLEHMGLRSYTEFLIYLLLAQTKSCLNTSPKPKQLEANSKILVWTKTAPQILVLQLPSK